VTCGDLCKVARKCALRAPEVDLEGERVLAAGVALYHPLQRRVGHEAAIPVVLAIDFDRGKARWQCSARHDMLRPDLVGVGIEVDKIARPDIDRARAEARHSGI
jgi:hypothetical protein